MPQLVHAGSIECRPNGNSPDPSDSGNFLKHYRPLAEVWTLFDNSGRSSQTVALAKGGELRIINQRMHSALLNRYGRV